MTKNCDEIFLKKIVKFHRYKKFISFKLNIIKPDLFYKDLKMSEDLISYIRPKIENKNIFKT